LASHDTADYGFQKTLANCYGMLANVYGDMRQPNKADASFQQALEIHERLVAANGSVPDYRADLASVYNNMGVAHGKSHRPDTAEESYRKALAIRKELVGRHP